MAGVFISYRQSDSKGWVDFLRNELAEVFEGDQIFLDRDTLAAGSWREQIEGAVSQCDVTLLVIGRNWLDDTNRLRLMDPSDVHRNEIAAALRRSGMHVIPVLVDEATMPRAEQLPEDLRPLLECQARFFSSTAAHRDADLKALVADLERVAALRRRNLPLAEQVFHIPFRLDDAQARAAIMAWIAARGLAPPDFVQTARITRLSPAWVPFWLGSANVAAPWKGRRGQSRSEARTQTGADGQPTTSTVTQIDYSDVVGEFNHRFENLVLEAGVALLGERPALYTAAGLQRLQGAARLPDEAVPVKPAGVSLAQAEVQLRSRMTAQVQERVLREIGGEKSSLTDLQPRYERVTVFLAHQPVFEGEYSYAGKDYPCCVNADSGEVASDSPLSAAKVGRLIGKVVLGLALVVGLVLLIVFWMG